MGDLKKLCSHAWAQFEFPQRAINNILMGLIEIKHYHITVRSSASAAGVN